jgi:hypothetical protein
MYHVHMHATTLYVHCCQLSCRHDLCILCAVEKQPTSSTPNRWFAQEMDVPPSCASYIRQRIIKTALCTLPFLMPWPCALMLECVA